MNPKEKRSIRCNSVEYESLSIREIARLREGGELEGPVEFLSVKSHTWLPIAGFMADFIDHPPRIDSMRSAGVKVIKILGAGTDNECAACAALLDRAMPIAEAPTLPPAGCSCVPWCRCIVITVS